MWGDSGLPGLCFAAFQMTFAIIASAIISGSLVERMRFSAYSIMLALWSLLIYAPLCHWVWGPGGWIAEMDRLMLLVFVCTLPVLVRELKLGSCLPIGIGLLTLWKAVVKWCGQLPVSGRRHCGMTLWNMFGMCGRLWPSKFWWMAVCLLAGVVSGLWVRCLPFA